MIATLALVIFGYLNIKGTELTVQMQFVFAVVMVAGVVILTITVGFQPGAGLSTFTLIILALLFAAIIYSLMILATSMAAPWEAVADENHLWGTGGCHSGSCRANRYDYFSYCINDGYFQ